MPDNNTSSIRVRFAPAPTGIMHLGNIRTALMNYLFARQKHGTFIVRIEDTDEKRNVDPGAIILLRDLAWLGITYDEGPEKNGLYAPYFQSQRTEIYKNEFEILKQKNLVYRCFCTQEELMQKRMRQITLKMPPRYDRTCSYLSEQQIQQNLDSMIPFIWRFRIDSIQSLKINDLARGTVTFDLKHFSDFPITRDDGSFTFIFANFVDDMIMGISHVFRGEDHLSNTANQAALYRAFNKELPTYWHMPIICNKMGKKLSKRDFGFSLHNLQEEGFLPEAILNYLAIIGTSYEEEIMTLEELVQHARFDTIHTTGQIKYDIEKLRWVNRKWITKLNIQDLAQRCQPLLEQAYPDAKKLTISTLVMLLEPIKTDLVTLKDIAPALAFYFEQPSLTANDILACIALQSCPKLIKLTHFLLDHLADPESLQLLKQKAKEEDITITELFWFLRLALMGTTKGPAIHHLISMLGTQKTQTRLKAGLDLLQHIIT